MHVYPDKTKTSCTGKIKRVGRSGSIYRREEIKETSVRFTILETDDLQKPSISTRRHVESLPDPGRRSAN